MILTPGVDFLIRSSANYLSTSGIIYLILILPKYYAKPTWYISNWILVLSSFVLRIGYRVAQPWIKEITNSRAARARGAVLPPHVKENHIKLAKTLIQEPNVGYPQDTWSELLNKYGSTFRFSIGLDEAYFTTEPEHVKAMLATEFNNFEKGRTSFEDGKALFGTGVFNVDGDIFHRSITRPFFTKDRISDFELFERHTDEALRKAKARLTEGYPIDFQDLAARFTLDSATDYLFGHDMRSLDANLPYPTTTNGGDSTFSPNSIDNHPSNLFVKSFMAGQEFLIKRVLLGPLWPLAEIWKDKVSEHRKALDGYVKPFLERALGDKENTVVGKDGEKSVESSRSLLDYLVGQTSDQSIIMDEIFNLLLAGRDTTSALLTFSLYMLIEHPDMQQRLRQEILETIGSERCPTIEDLRKMKYLRAFLNEVSRLYAIVPLNGRSSIKPTVLAPSTRSDTGLYIPGGVKVNYSVFLMHRRKDLWALEFDPDRFLDYRVKKYLVPNPFIFCPFNAGPRICLGQQFAYNEASFFIVRLLQQFAGFELDDTPRPSDLVPNPEWKGVEGPKGNDRIRLTYSIILFVKGGLWVKMKDAV
ncbi:hypothetical protein AGABI1DRAFT_132556 [Agaricus bisporus var. burnettii JB137-S8]|uniref:Cytochrome P450 n=1 Tax=Agaricus bisporus var. burnettii (strain JB137-S8 / ATCC MYA-4627 / FGSC 10392) TaxID=597362 RepID=K5WIN0_AGABU|nr:uncharacterized protein AGABI1DRAFT_132556 [Agaricus bisporus var. burnettii JB137-S8]EKM75106.1 hypothetical protein AGABI1DRAFT_132556 [Agaricus bisporus var. burnettii JB137-S8]